MLHDKMTFLHVQKIEIANDLQKSYEISRLLKSEGFKVSKCYEIFLYLDILQGM